MEFLVEFNVEVPTGTAPSEVEERQRGEAIAAAKLARDGNLTRLWRPQTSSHEPSAIGLFQADTDAELNALLADLPLAGWMQVKVIPLATHANDPSAPSPDAPLPAPRLTLVYRLRATLGEPLDLGTTAVGHRRIIPLTGGAFTGPELAGELVPDGSADWQTVLPDGTALGDIRYTLRTIEGELLYVRSSGVRHGSAAVLARLSRGEAVDPREYTFRTSTRIEAATTPAMDWLNKGVFISVAGRHPDGVSYDAYLVG